MNTSHGSQLRHGNRGFGTLEVLLILLVVVVLGGTGFYVYERQRRAISSKGTTSNSTQNSQNELPVGPVFNKLPDDWAEYKNDSKGLRLGYPKEWGTLDSNLQTPSYEDDSKNLQGQFSIAISSKADFTVVARKYGATIRPSADGKTWTVAAENPADADGYKIGDTYKTTDQKVNGGSVIDLSFVDEECSQTRWLISLKDSYAVVTIPELCPANLTPVSAANQTSYDTLKTNFLSSITIY